MAASGDATVQRRILSKALRSQRERAGLTQHEAAGRLDWSQSKLIRIETGGQGLSVTDLKAMLELYQVTDAGITSDLMMAARGSRGLSWWHQYRDIVSPQFAQYLGHEDIASSFRIFSSFLIPGLLHTEEYASALLDAFQEPERTLRIVRLRLERQKRLLANPELDFKFIINQEALYRWIGGPDAMRRQLQHLLDISRQPNISIQIVPFTAGAHPGLGGSFIMIDIAAANDSMVFLESVGGDKLIKDDPDNIAKHGEYFKRLDHLSLPSGRAAALLEALIDRLLHADNAHNEGL